MTEKLKAWEYPKDSGIRIREKINTRGKDPYGVSYAVTVPSRLTAGARIRKQFPTKKEAESYATDQWNGSKMQGEAFFEATREERIQFVEALPLLREKGISLREAVAFAIPPLRPEGGDRKISEIVDELHQSKIRRFETGAIRQSTLHDFKIRSRKIKDELGDRLAKDLSLGEARAWIESLDLSPRSVRNYTNSLSEILQFGVSRRYIAENVLDGLTKSDRSELYGSGEQEEPAILTPKEAQTLLQNALKHPELDMLAPITLGLFCGLRTEEIKGLDWRDIRMDEGFVTVSGKIAKKRRIRNVTLSENAKAWLSLCPNREGKVTRNNYVTDFNHRFHNLLKLSGWTTTPEKKNPRSSYEKSNWKRNALRHSFGSYHFGLYGDSVLTAKEMGHQQGDTVLFDHYRALVTANQATEYFRIKPKAGNETLVKFA